MESVGSRFRKMGRNFRKAKKHDEAASRDLLSNRFRDNKILIHPRCACLIAELRSYRWDPKSKGEKPIQKNDDAIDALRYLCAECVPEQHPRTEKPMDSYERMRRNRFLEQDDDIGENDWQGF